MATSAQGRALSARLMERLWVDAESACRSKILESIEPMPEAVLLDVGCDDGAWTDAIREKLRTVPEHTYGLEIVPERADLARSRGFEVHSGDLEARWPFDDRSFEIVHANQVIEHVKRLDHFVEEIKRVLVPGGRAIVSTENLASWHNVAALALGYQPFSAVNISRVRPIGNRFSLHAREIPAGESWQHVHVITLTALRDIFVAHGFMIEAAWGTGYHPFLGRLARQLASLDPRHAHFIGITARA